MNIMHVATGLFDGGVTSHIITLTKYMLKSGNNVTIITFEIPNNKNDELLRNLGAKIYYIPFNKMKKKPFICLVILYKIMQIIKLEKIDVIHSHYREPNIFLEIISKLNKVPYVWTYHLTGVPYTGIKKIFSFHGNQTIAVSQRCKEDLVNRFKIHNSKINLVLNGINTSEYEEFKINELEIRNKYNLREDTIVICLLARLVEIKGQKEAILAISKLKNKFPNICLLLAGDASNTISGINYKKNLNKLINDLDLKENVKLVGFQNPKEILGISKLSILPSYEEGLGIVCLESMIMRVPVIRTNTAGSEEMRDVCQIVRIGDVEDLAKKIELLLRDNEKYNLLAAGGVAFVKDNATVDVMSKKITGVYHKAIMEM